VFIIACLSYTDYVTESPIVNLTVVEEGFVSRIFFQDERGAGGLIICPIEETPGEVLRVLKSHSAKPKLELVTPNWVKEELEKQGYPGLTKRQILQPCKI
jgi:hypothetical protein